MKIFLISCWVFAEFLFYVFVNPEMLPLVTSITTLVFGCALLVMFHQDVQIQTIIEEMRNIEYKLYSQQLRERDADTLNKISGEVEC